MQLKYRGDNMLRIFVGYESDETVVFNDIYFNKITMNKLDYERSYNIIKGIDEVELTKDFKIVSKFNGKVVSLDKLSTGCKTALNIMFNPSKTFLIEECGMNALTTIYRNSIGNASTRYLIGPFFNEMDVDILIVFNGKEKRFSKVEDMLTWVEESEVVEDE